MTSLTPAVEVVNGQPLVSSLDIAAHFEKPHDAVLKVIRKIMAECPEEFRRVNFYETFRTVAGPKNSTRQEKYFLLTRDAFALVAMGFTGKKALAWKLIYIEVFNSMEKALMDAAQKAVAEATPAIESEEDRKRRLGRERKRRQRERDRLALSVAGQKTLPAGAYLPATHKSSTGYAPGSVEHALLELDRLHAHVLHQQNEVFRFVNEVKPWLSRLTGPLYSRVLNVLTKGHHISPKGYSILALDRGTEALHRGSTSALNAMSESVSELAVSIRYAQFFAEAMLLGDDQRHPLMESRRRAWQERMGRAGYPKACCSNAAL